MDAKEYFEIKRRMTKQCSISCFDCPFDEFEDCDCCTNLEQEYPEKAIELVKEWAEKHPKFTNKDKLNQIIKEAFGEDKEAVKCTVATNACMEFCDTMDCCECVEFWQSEYKAPENNI